MTFSKWFVAISISCLAGVVSAQTPAPNEQPGNQANAAEPINPLVGKTDQTTDEVKQRFSERFGNMPVTEVRHAPYGLFEVQLGNSLVYTNGAVDFVLDGHMIDASTRRDITEDRLQELSRIDFDALPLELALTQVRGDGSRKMAIFEDPNCGYCKQLRRNLAGIDNLTIYTYLLPILSEDSARKVTHVWCAEDPVKVWDEWMLQNKVPPQKQCDAPVQALRKLAQGLMVQGTPAIFFTDGTRVPGAVSKEEVEKRLQAAAGQ